MSEGCDEDVKVWLSHRSAALLCTISAYLYFGQEGIIGNGPMIDAECHWGVVDHSNYTVIPKAHMFIG